jgi:chemotaxis protein MotB
LETQLAAALIASDELKAALKAAEEEQLETASRLLSVEQAMIAALSERDELASSLQDEAMTRGDLEARMATLEAALADLTSQRDALRNTAAERQAEAQDLSSRLETSEQALAVALAEVAALKAGLGDREELRQQLAAALAARLAAEQSTQKALSESERRDALLAAANKALETEEAKSAESQRRLAVLNEQVAALRAQLGSLQGLLESSEAREREAQVELTNLGSRLNAALARVASEERQRAALEEAERIRLEQEAARLAAEAKQLENYRSEFFGRLRDLLADREGVQIVGDRFVFSSEVLFEPASADLSNGGQAQIANVVALLQDVAAEIPPEIDWVIRVDGHTDKNPLSGQGQFRDNWELSQARALSVVRYMTDSLGFAPNRLAATGFGEYQPIDPGDTPEALARNRRIELKLTEK